MESDHQPENIFDQIAGGLYWKDQEGIYMGCNDAVVEKCNFSSKTDIIGKKDCDLWPAEADKIRQVDLYVMASGTTIQMEEFITLRDGEVFHFSTIKAPLKDNKGNIIGIIGNSLDVTELKKAQKNAETASLAKTQFLALMSHEIRIPLTGIISSTSILAEGGTPPDKTTQLIKIIQQSGQHLLSTLNSILEFAKLEAAQFELLPTITTLHTEISGIVHLFLAHAEQKGLSLVLQYDTTLPEKVIIDPMVMRHILTNLISNAIQYTDKGGVIVRVQRIASTAKSVTIKIEVADTGMGIPSDKLTVIFDRFAQLQDTYTPKQSRSGSGLGLSIVRKLAHLMKTNVNVASMTGKGSTFSIVVELPLPV